MMVSKMVMWVVTVVLPVLMLLCWTTLLNTTETEAENITVSPSATAAAVAAAEASAPLDDAMCEDTMPYSSPGAPPVDIKFETDAACAEDDHLDGSAPQRCWSHHASGGPATELPEAAEVVQLVPTLARLPEEEWVTATVPHSVLSFVKVRVAKLISLAQITSADADLSAERRRHLIHRLRVNFDAVTLVGSELCGQLDLYVDLRMRRLQMGVDSPASVPVADEDGVWENMDVENNLYRPNGGSHQQVLASQLRGEVLRDLLARNADWAAVHKLCGSLHSKMLRYGDTIEELLGSRPTPGRHHDNRRPSQSSLSS